MGVVRYSVPTMTSMLLAPQAPRSVVWFHSGNHGFEPTKRFMIADGGKNVLQLNDVPVFRSGEFCDSYGDRTNWEPLHMAQMKSNFDYLRQTKVFENVPVRKGHGSFFGDPMQDLIGWHTNMRTEDLRSPVDGLTYTYLLADFYIFEKDAAENVDAGNWPNRSSEVGRYVNNNQSEYWPAYMGFAYVDIPAVEGLNFSKYQKDADGKFSILVDNPKEFGVTAPVVPTPPAAPATPALPEITPPAAPAATPPAAPAAPAFSFSIGGTATHDFAAVQAHIAKIEGENAVFAQFQKETMEAGRKSFVSSLATGDAPKILQTQVADLEAHVLTLNDSQYAAFRKIYEAAPPAPVLQQHGQTNATGNPIVAGSGTKDERTERISVLTEIIGRHRLSGAPEETVQKMASYIELQRLQAAS